MKKEFRPSEALYPTPVVMVSCAGEDGKPNIITLAWVGIVCSSPPMIGISIRPGRHSHKLIEESGEFVVNVPSCKLVRETDLCGILSGRNADKFAEAALTPRPASRVKAPLIEECPTNIECVVRNKLQLGSHDLFIGEVVAVHQDEEVLGPDGRPQSALANPLVYVLGEYWSLGEGIGRHGFARVK